MPEIESTSASPNLGPVGANPSANTPLVKQKIQQTMVGRVKKQLPFILAGLVLGYLLGKRK